MKSLQGQLLIASPQLADPNFARTVVLMVQHGHEGALGLVLNRPLELTVRQACEQVMEEEVCAIEAFLHQGGPCEGPLMVVHGQELASEVEVAPGLFFTTERDKIEWLMKTVDITAKFFVGYAGWGAGQLEAEMETSSWLTIAATHQRVFEPVDEQWARLMREVTVGRWIDPKHIPDDPSVN